MIISCFFKANSHQKNTMYLNDKIIIFANIKNTTMSLFRVILAIFFPPLAVIDKGCGSLLIVFLLTLCGWVPGVIAALVILNKN